MTSAGELIVRSVSRTFHVGNALADALRGRLLIRPVGGGGGGRARLRKGRAARNTQRRQQQAQITHHFLPRA